MKNIYKKTIIVLFYTLTISSVLAQVEVPTDDGGSLFISIFPSSYVLDFRRFGLLSILGFAAMLFIGFLLILSVFTVIRGGIIWIRSQGDSAGIEKGFNFVRNTLIGIGLTFAIIMVYAAISMFIGAGNLFDWPVKLAQCGETGEILFRAEYAAGRVSPGLFEEEPFTYCCRDLSYMDEDRNVEPFGEVGDGFDSIDNSGSIDFQGAAVGSRDGGGWLFIRNAGENLNPDTIPQYLVGANNCESFNI